MKEVPSLKLDGEPDDFIRGAFLATLATHLDAASPELNDARAAATAAQVSMKHRSEELWRTPTVGARTK